MISLNSSFNARPGISALLSCSRLTAIFLLSLLLAGALLSPLHAQPAIDDAANIRLPADFDQVEFYLVTVDVGNRVWDNFGHTALRMVDQGSDTDLVFNWGLFDTSVGVFRFTTNFALGIMNYQLGVSPPSWEFGRYQQENRTVWQDRLRLNSAQKRTLYQRLAWNVRPENISYDYDYFYDNCTTRVRDYIDEALNGALADSSRALTQRTFRDEVLDHYASVPLIGFSLNVLMNERIDQRMTQWQQMFLPAQLRQQLQRQGLLDESEVLMEFPAPQAQPGGHLVSGLMALLTLGLLLSVRRASIASFSSQPGFTLRWPQLSYRLLGLIGLIVALFSGVYGLMLSLGWWLSGHQDIHANINLLLFWPTDLLALGMAFNWLLKGRAYNVSNFRQQIIVTYLLLHLISALVYLVMALFGLSGQSLGTIALFVLPLLLLFSLVSMIAGIQPVRSIRWG